MKPSSGSYPATSTEAAHTSRAALRVIVSGGGTGGHVYPAIAIADELKRLRPDTEFLFVGAQGRMEMEKVPRAGYRIEGLWISGLQRKLTLDNLSFPLKLMASIWKSIRIVRKFRPDIAIGTGGYAGGPVLYAAAKMGVPTLIQEPNAFAGLANKWLGKHVDKICVAFPGMDRFFPEGRLVETGNPVREQLLDQALAQTTATETPTILLMGGSGGARALNEAMRDSLALIRARPQVQWLWQCGKVYHEAFRACAVAQLPNVTLLPFIDDMAQAYAQATVVVARAGSTTIAEIQYLGKPTILVPSPWVAEDHQTKNALVLVERQAARLLPDAETRTGLVPTAFGLLDDPAALARLGQNARAMAQTGAVTRIAETALQLVSAHRKTTN